MGFLEPSCILVLCPAHAVSGAMSRDQRMNLMLVPARVELIVEIGATHIFRGRVLERPTYRGCGFWRGQGSTVGG